MKAIPTAEQTEFAASLEGPDGSTGMVHVEHMIYGTYRPSGFEGPAVWKDPEEATAT